MGVRLLTFGGILLIFGGRIIIYITKRVSGLYPIEVRPCNAKPSCKHTGEDDDDDECNCVDHEI